MNNIKLKTKILKEAVQKTSRHGTISKPMKPKRQQRETIIRLYTGL